MMDGLTTVCPSCGGNSKKLLATDQVCATCMSTRAWTAHQNKKLIISTDDIATSDARRSGDTNRSVPWRAWIFPSISLVLAALGFFALIRLFSTTEIMPLADLIWNLQSRVYLAFAIGTVSIVIGTIAIIRLRRSRYHRKLRMLSAHLIGITVGIPAALLGGLGSWSLLGGFGWQYDDMPPRAQLDSDSEIVQRIANATAVVVAPSEAGDATLPGLGTGSVVATNGTKVYVLTNSHVAMPYATTAAFRNPANASPVWVQFSDGRGRGGRVVWLGAPSIDVAVVEVTLSNPPAPITIGDHTRNLRDTDPVLFVPNPYRDGWLVHYGVVRKRVKHKSPAGEVSLVHSNLPLQHGDSGSGLFDDAGQLIGINTWTKDSGGPSGIHLPVEVLKPLVGAINAGDFSPTALPVYRASGVGTNPIQPQAAPHKARGKAAADQ